MAGLAHPHCSERSSDRMASLLGQIRRAGSLLPRRSASKYRLVEHRKASIGITASIAKLTESAGTSERLRRTEQSPASSKTIGVYLNLLRQVYLSLLRQTPSIRFGLGGIGGRYRHDQQRRSPPPRLGLILAPLPMQLKGSTTHRLSCFC